MKILFQNRIQGTNHSTSMYIAVRIPVFYDPESQKSYKSDSGAGSRAGIVTPLGATLAEQLTIAFVRSIKCGMALPPPHLSFLCRLRRARERYRKSAVNICGKRGRLRLHRDTEIQFPRSVLIQISMKRLRETDRNHLLLKVFQHNLREVTSALNIAMRRIHCSCLLWCFTHI